MGAGITAADTMGDITAGIITAILIHAAPMRLARVRPLQRRERVLVPNVTDRYRRALSFAPPAGRV